MDTKGTANRVSSEQEALRASKYFGSLHIEQTRYRGSVTTFVQVVLEESGGWIAANTKVLCSNAAYAYGIDV